MSVCIPTQDIKSRGLEEASGLSLDGGQCEGLDADDNVRLIDEFGHTAYDSNAGTLKDFQTFLNDTKAHNGQFYSREIGGAIFHATGGQPILAFPSSCSQENSDHQHFYVCQRSDDFTEEYTLKEPDKGQGQLVLQVKAPNGRTVRQLHRTYPDARFGEMMEWLYQDTAYLSVLDAWSLRMMSGFPLWKSRVLVPGFSNPHRYDQYALPTGPKQEVSLTPAYLLYQKPEERHNFMRLVDDMMAADDVRLDAAQNQVYVNDQEYIVRSSQTSPEESYDALVGMAQTAAFLKHLTNEHSLRVYLGGADLVGLTQQDNLSARCQQVAARIVREPNSGGTVCQGDNAALVKMHAQHDDFKAEASRRVVHEIGHLLHLNNDALAAEWRIFHANYVYTSLKKAGVQEDSDAFKRLMGYALDRSSNSISLAPTQRKQFSDWFKQYQLKRYFPTFYSLSNDREFFAVLFENYRPWHSFDTSPKVYKKFYYAFDAFKESGMKAFLEEAKRQYPDLEVYNGMAASYQKIGDTFLNTMLGVASSVFIYGIGYAKHFTPFKIAGALGLVGSFGYFYRRSQS